MAIADGGSEALEILGQPAAPATLGEDARPTFRGHPLATFRKTHETRRVVVLMSGDALAMALSVVLGVVLLDSLAPHRTGQMSRLPYALLAVPVFLLAFGIRGLYRRDSRPLQRPLMSDVVKVGQALLTGVVLVMVVDALYHGLSDPDLAP